MAELSDGAVQGGSALAPPHPRVSPRLPGEAGLSCWRWSSRRRGMRGEGARRQVFGQFYSENSIWAGGAEKSETAA